MMTKKYKFPFFLLAGLALVLLIEVIIYSDQIAVLSPKGFIALQERDLIVISTILMLIVVIPVLIMAPLFAWRYHESNKDAVYTPDTDSNFVAELIWWGFPCLIVLLLSVLAWQSSQALDPFKPLDTDQKPLRIQVVALQWKWLFLYPEQHIATLNYFQFPEKTSIHFEVTADAPMNSFWIPQLGGQIYAMPGMKTQLHLIADQTGDFRGSSANISGKGFAGMHFISKATSETDFDTWVKTVQESALPLTAENYHDLAAPSENNPPTSYRLADGDLFETIVMKYMRGP